MDVDEKRFSNKVTIASFWMAIFVVYIHVNNTLTYTFDLSKQFDYWAYRIEDWGQAWQQVSVPTFFIISAFLFFRNYKPELLKKKLFSRFKTLLIPYLVWNIIPWLLLAVVQILPFAVNLSTKAEFSFSSFIDSVVFCKYSVLWYVRNLLIYVLLTPIIYWVTKHKRLSEIIIIAFIIGNITWFNFYGYSNLLCYWAPFYLLGSYMALHRPKWLVAKVSQKVRIVSLVILIALLIEAFFPEVVLFSETGRYVFRLMLPLPFWYVLDFFSFDRKPEWVETISFPIYCTHAIILEFIEKIIRIAFGDNTRVAIISYFVTPIPVLILLVYALFTFSKTLPRTYRFVFGNRGYKK